MKTTETSIKKQNVVLNGNLFSTLYDDLNDVLSDYYEGYVEMCKDNDIEPKGENSNDFYDYYYDSKRMDYDDMKETIKILDDKYNEYGCVIIGELGLWNGNKNIYPVYKRNLNDAIEKITTVKFESYIKIDLYDDATIHIVQSHHDGTNAFYIKLLSEKGEEGLNEIDSFNSYDKTNYLNNIKVKDIY
jgi:hypothetical protein